MTELGGLEGGIVGRSCKEDVGRDRSKSWIMLSIWPWFGQPKLGSNARRTGKWLSEMQSVSSGPKESKLRANRSFEIILGTEVILFSLVRPRSIAD